MDDLSQCRYFGNKPIFAPTGIPEYIFGNRTYLVGRNEPKVDKGRRAVRTHNDYIVGYILTIDRIAEIGRLMKAEPMA